VNKKYVFSRNKAMELIKNLKVKVNGKIETKPSRKITTNDKIEILENERYVSRAAYKLKNYLDKYKIDFNKKIVLDIGSSTGGFTQVALEYGADEIYSVDVGNNQLHNLLRENPKIKLFENTDIREFEVDKKFDVVLSDVSFISLLKILDVVDKYAKDTIILLFKPQFEVGKDVKRDKKGVVLDKMAIEKARENFQKECSKLGWKLIRSEESSIKGKEGNTEYIYHFKKEK
jgi:23S rRNA (cytidine1920-2'-O)/16S rRNA (cytidine1409-2'-O)-methyltransferase